MRSSSTDVVGPTALLADLVRIPSPSGDEAAAAARLADWAADRGLDTTADDAAVKIEVAGRAAGPVLWLASHLDTVPAGAGWSGDPFGAAVVDGRMSGRGAVDAKGCVAAMAHAALDLARSGGPDRGRVVVLATYGEETANTTMPRALERLGRPDAAIVGEPTSLRPCVAQRGLLVLRIRWRGRAAHAGWAADLEDRDNAIEKAARGLAALAALRFERRHPVLGSVSVNTTRIEGGTASNVIPDACVATLDVRTTPEYAPEEIVATIGEAVGGEVEIASRRFVPCETPPGSPLLAAIRRAQPDAEPFGSPTASDWVFLRDSDTVKLGPGDSRLSHTPDESIALEEVAEAARLYASIAREYLS